LEFFLLIYLSSTLAPAAAGAKVELK